MNFNCNSCNHKNTFVCCELCKKWLNIKKRVSNFNVCSTCNKKCEDMYLKLINEKDNKIIDNKKNIIDKYKSLLIDFDGY